MPFDDKCLLVAEDNADDFFILERSFKRAGLTIALRRVENGVQAISYLTGEGSFADRETYPMPCLLLLDLKMPFKNGFDVLKWMRDHRTLKTLPVLILSSSRDPGDIHRAYDGGANAFLSKPTSIDLMVDSMKAIENFWLTYNCFDDLANNDGLRG
jgi:CheY-like chemotaxis protein